MNIALWNSARQEFYIACVRKHEEGGWVAQGKRISGTGRLLEMCQPFYFLTRKEAERKCRVMAKIKKEKGGLSIVPLETLSNRVQMFLEVPPEMQLTPQEMVSFLAESKKERYVVFKDVSGIDDYFDAGVEYLGYETDDPEYLIIHDRFGNQRGVFRSRLESVVKTEISVKVAQ